VICGACHVARSALRLERGFEAADALLERDEFNRLRGVAGERTERRALAEVISPSAAAFVSRPSRR
jgi:hypothetical protein